MCETTKELGNKFFKEGNYDEALKHYIKGLQISDDKDEKLTLLKNKSMCYIKLEQYEKAVQACDAALEINSMDEKSLYRRSQAYRHLDLPEKAYTDLKRLIQIYPKNKLYQTSFMELQKIVQTKLDQSQSFVGRVDAMFDLLKKNPSEVDKVKYINNITALSKENKDNFIWKHPSKDILFELCKRDQPVKVIEAAQRCLSCLSAKSINQSLDLFLKHGPQYFADMIYSQNPEHCRLAGLYLESILLGLTQLKQYKKDKEKYDEEQRLTCGKMYPKRYSNYKIDSNVEKYVTECFMTLIKAVNSKRLTNIGRDSILEILIRFVPSKEGVNWSRTLLKTDGALLKLLEVGAASHRTEIKSESVAKSVSLIDTTEKTKMNVAILLAAIYDDLISDQERDKFRDICCEFIMDLLTDDMIESKVEAANCIGMFFQGPYEVGNAVLGRAGIMEGLLLLLNPQNQQLPSYRRVALEALVHACTKRDKCKSVVTQAAPILEQVYRDSNEEDIMKLMALVGMCKLGVASGRDSSKEMQPLADGSTLELAKSCRRFLLSSSSKDHPNSLKAQYVRWSAEGLAFLTLDAEVKEMLTDDKLALEALLKVNMKSVPECLYPMATVLMNITNSYEKPDILPEMIELAKYSKQHVPETHKFDEDEYVNKRINKLMDAGLPKALYELTLLSEGGENGGVTHDASREMLARVYVATTTIQANRGNIVQAGGAKSLISLSTKNTDVGKVLAAQSLAKIAITMNPSVAFAGQRSFETIKPLLSLLHMDNSGLQNFEGLMALTNLASIDDAHRRRILDENGFSKIENYVYEDHDEIKRAAVQCICNMINNEQVQKKYLEQENDRVKTLFLYCLELEDPELIIAASGALAVLSDSPKLLLDKLAKVNDWLEILQTIMASENIQIRQRGIYITRNLIMEGTEEFRRFIVKSNMLEVLMAIEKQSRTGPKSDTNDAIVEWTKEILRKLVKSQLITPIPEISEVEEEEGAE